MKLSPQTILTRAAGIRVELATGAEARVWIDGDVVRGGPHSLAVLDAFARPTSFEEALRGLRARVSAVEDSVDLVSTILQFFDAAILVEEGKEPARRPLETSGFDAPTAHVLMLDDRARTSCFLDAIRRVVRPGDVVVDLGTGTGVLAVAAARAGARRVYAIEARGIGRVAREVFAANGVADRVTLVEGWSTQVALPERADVLVSEILGDELLSERAVESIRDARLRHLKPDARIVPESVRLLALPLALPSEVLRRRTPGAGALHDWRAWYGIDLTALGDAARLTAQPFYENPFDCRPWEAVTEPADLGTIDFRAVESRASDRSARVSVRAVGRVDAVLVYPEIHVAAGCELSLSPRQATPGNHWRTPLWILGEPLVVAPGDELVVTHRGHERNAGVDVRVEPRS